MTGQICKFEKAAELYNRYRPKWPLTFAQLTLEHMGEKYTTPAKFPLNIISIGTGLSLNTSAFDILGHNDFFVEPNKEILKLAIKEFERRSDPHSLLTDLDKKAFAKGSQATYIAKNALDCELPERVDMIICAQSSHTLRSQYSDQGTAETIRKKWASVLTNDNKPRISIWYYQPDPEANLTQDLHHILSSTSKSYHASNTQLLNANYLEPNNFQPWISAKDMHVSDPIHVQNVTLRKQDLGRWLRTYSFAPKDKTEFREVLKALRNDWFPAHQGEEEETVTLNYKGVITQGPLRQDPFPMNEIDQPIDVASPLRLAQS